jgi:hypothetical protein
MKNSKWSYILCGASALAAIFAAAIHNGLLVVFNTLFTYVNWRVAESKRGLEEKALLEAYQEMLIKMYEENKKCPDVPSAEK